jgi:signal transduction histidine kinase
MNPDRRESDPDLYEILKDAWLTTQLGTDRKPRLQLLVHDFFEGSQRTFDRARYSEILKTALAGALDSSLFGRFPGWFDLCGVEYRTLAPRIVGEGVVPEASLYLLDAGVSPEDLRAIDNVMREAYGRELTYLSLIPPNFGWLQVVYHRVQAVPELVSVFHTLDLPIQEELEWLEGAYGPRWYEGYLEENKQREIKEEVRRRLREKVVPILGPIVPGSELERLAEMVSSTPFMTLARMTQTGEALRSILYLPAHLHGERLGGAVLMGPKRLDSPRLLEALHIILQVLLTHLRLVEFPEEARLAERDVLLRQLVRRFRHNMMHPLGNLMDSARRFQESFQQLLVTFERGIEAWKPDLMPNPIVTFLNYIAEEFRSEVEAPEPQIEAAGGRAKEEDEEEDDTFPIDVKGTDRIEHFDRSILAEVFRNLLVNTSRYALRKGLDRVVIDAGDSGTLITYREIGGPGLPPAIAADPWRLHSRDPGEAESSGQGLFLTKKLMEVHGGDIRYDRDNSGGNKFSISLRGRLPDGQALQDYSGG